MDFAIDYDAQEGADRFRQMCDMLILAFNVKHNVSDKNQYYGGTQTTMEHKNNKTKWGPFEIECYRKCIQKQESNVQWRLELRYMQSKRRQKRRIYRDIMPMLDELRSELRTLPDYFEEAQVVMNATLADKFRENVAGSGKTIKLNDFIFLNRDRVFSREQLKGLFKELGNGEEHAARQAAYNYCKRRKAHRLISKNEFTAFVNALDAGIETWVKNDQKFGDFFTGRMRERENKYNQLPF